MSVHLDRRRMLVLSCSLVAALLLALIAGLAPTNTLAQAGCQELLINGGFENGHDGWVEYSSQHFELIDPFYPHTGAKSVWLAANNNEEDWIAQTVQLPGNAGSLQLNYWWAVYTTENPGGAFDFLRVQLMRVDGTLLTTLNTYSNDSAESWLWNNANVDVSSYAGQTVQLRFYGKNDANNETSFFVDDVSLQTCTSGGTVTPVTDPTATATSTHTPTPTITPSPTLTITPGPSPTPTNTPRARIYLPLVLR